MTEHAYPANPRLAQGLADGTISVLLVPVTKQTASIDGHGRTVPYGQSWGAFDFSRAWVDGLDCQYLHVPLRHADTETVHRLYCWWEPGDTLRIKTPHYRAYKGTPNEQIWDRYTRTCRWPTRQYGESWFEGRISCNVEPELDRRIWKSHPALAMPNWAVQIRKMVKSIAVYRLGFVLEADIRKYGFAPNPDLLDGYYNRYLWLSEIWPQEQKRPYDGQAWAWAVKL